MSPLLILISGTFLPKGKRFRLSPIFRLFLMDPTERQDESSGVNEAFTSSLISALHVVRNSSRGLAECIKLSRKLIGDVESSSNNEIPFSRLRGRTSTSIDTHTSCSFKLRWTDATLDEWAYRNVRKICSARSVN